MSRRPLSAQRQPVELSHPWAADQAQKSLDFTRVVGGGVELEGKSASIKSISECIQFSNARSFSSRIERVSSCFSRISLAGSRRQLNIDKNERKRESDEPDAPLLGERALALGEVDVVLGQKQRNQANDAAEHGFHQGFAIEPEAPQRRCRSEIPRRSSRPKRPNRKSEQTILARSY